jgi:hypothetical protein
MVVFNEGFFLYLRQPGKTKLNLQKIKEAGWYQIRDGVDGVSCDKANKILYQAAFKILK